METRNKINIIFNKIITVDLINENISAVIEEYEKLNEKCDRVILKIKERKNKQNSK